jgi:hypothetical protein
MAIKGILVEVIWQSYPEALIPDYILRQKVLFPGYLDNKNENYSLQ